MATSYSSAMYSVWLIACPALPCISFRSPACTISGDSMGTYQRINVASGRPLEKLAHYSRALRAGTMVLQAGTTAMDRQGNVRGEGDIAQQVDAIMRLAEWSMGKAGGCTSVSPAGEVQAVGDWAAQTDIAHNAIQWALAQAG